MITCYTVHDYVLYRQRIPNLAEIPSLAENIGQKYWADGALTKNSNIGRQAAKAQRNFAAPTLDPGKETPQPPPPQTAFSPRKST
jgi:hypothetical protein